MLRNNNRQIIRKLVKRNFRYQKLRNVLTVISIFITIIIFIVLFTFSYNLYQIVKEQHLRSYESYFDVVLEHITENEKARVESDPRIEEQGSSRIVGRVLNEEMRSRSVFMEFADETYIKEYMRYPQVGKLPKEEDEVALDAYILELYGIPQVVGEKITLKWEDSNHGEIEKEFIVSGFWDGDSRSIAGQIWVSEAFLELYEIPEIYTLGLNLYDKWNADHNVEKILEENGIEGIAYKTSQFRSLRVQQHFLSELISFVWVSLGVAICSCLIIYNIFQISVEADTRFYGKLKTLGTSPSQIKKIVYGQINRLCFIGILAGILAGIILGYMITAEMLPRTSMNRETSLNVTLHPLIPVAAAVLTYLLVSASCRKPAKIASQATPIEASKYMGTVRKRKQKKYRKKRLSPLNLAGIYLVRDKKQFLIIVLSVAAGFAVSCYSYATYASYDVNRYMESMIIGDYILSDSSLESMDGEYNSYGTTLTEEFQAGLESIGGVSAVDKIRLQFEEISLNENTYNTVINFFEDENFNRLEYMSYDPFWVDSYNRMKERRKCTLLVYGVEGRVLDTLVGEKYIVEGQFDLEKFQTGNYLLVCDLNRDEEDISISPYRVGDMIEAEGGSYEVMAVINKSIDFLDEDGNGEDMFVLVSYASIETFENNYSANGIHSLIFETEDGVDQAVQSYIDTYEKKEHKDVIITSKQLLKEQFLGDIRQGIVPLVVLSIMLMAIGVLNYLNYEITSTLARKKTISVMQSVGMSKKQVKKMFLYEYIFRMIAIFSAAVIVSYLAVEAGVRPNAEVSWVSTYHFSMLPLVVGGPLFILSAFILHRRCGSYILKQEIVEGIRSLN